LASAVTVPHQVLHASQACGTGHASVQSVPDEAALARLLQDGNLLGAPRKSVAIDFTRTLVLQVSMGQQASAGAQLAVAGTRADAPSQQLVVDMLWSPPDPQRMNAMVITRPCVVFSVPRGDYRSVRVLDQQGRQQATAPLGSR
jgi:hypothetical protein